MRKKFQIETKNQVLFGTVDFDLEADHDEDGPKVVFYVSDVHVEAMENINTGEAHKRCDIVTDHGWCRQHSVSPERGEWFELLDQFATKNIDFVEILKC